MNFYYYTVLIFALLLSSTRAIAQPTLKKNDIQQYSQSLAEVFQLINRKSYFPIDIPTALQKSLDAFVKTDEYSHFLNPHDYKQLKQATTGSFYGIGVAIAPKKAEDDYLLILKVIPNSPAHTHAIQAHDKIIAIDNTPVRTLTTDEALLKLKSTKKYSPITLTILRHPKSLFTLTVKRDIVKEEHIRTYDIQNKKILYITMQHFTADIGSQLRKIIELRQKKQLNGIILDVRNNPGGILHAAVDCASTFLKKNSLVVITKNRDQQVLDYLATQKEPVLKQALPIIILINNFTASAAEIFAGALQDYTRETKTTNPYIFLVGTTTHGKGTVQEVIPLNNNCALKITTSLYYLPRGRSIHQHGILPDFFVKQQFSASADTKLIDKLYNQRTKKQSVQKNNKIQFNKPSKPTYASWQKKYIKQLKKDHQLNCAIHIIELLQLGKKLNSRSINTHAKSKKFLQDNSCWCTELDIHALSSK